MRYEDDDFEYEEYDDGEAFNNTMVHVGTYMIIKLFRHWKERWPSMPDAEFLPVLDIVRQQIGEFVGPNDILDLWNWVVGEYQEKRQIKEAKITWKGCELGLKKYLPEWHDLAKEVAPPVSAKPSRKKRKRKS